MKERFKHQRWVIYLGSGIQGLGALLHKCRVFGCICGLHSTGYKGRYKLDMQNNGMISLQLGRECRPAHMRWYCLPLILEGAMGC